MARSQLHLYGVIDEAEPLRFGPPSADGPDLDVWAVPHSGIAAVVSESRPSPGDDLSKSDLVRRLAAHQAVIERVMETHTIVPVKFGTLAGGAEEARSILETGHETFVQALRALAGKVELDVVATWSSMSAVYSEIGRHPSILAARRELAAASAGDEAGAKVRLGKRVKALLEERNATLATELFEMLAAQALDCRHNVVAGDAMIINAAFLLAKGGRPPFLRALRDVDERHGGTIDFRCVGPLPAHSFSTVQVERPTQETLDAARVALELGPKASAREISEAYRVAVKRHHPDRNAGDPNVARRYQEVTEAYETLRHYAENARLPLDMEASGGVWRVTTLPRVPDSRAVPLEEIAV